jgi:biopolymer transport protein ExbD
VRFSRQPVEETAVNLTPLIDVVFLLLIFFMVSTTFTKERELKINLPEANAEAMAATPKMIEISISADGEYAVNGRRLVNREPETLRRALIDIAQGDAEIPLVIAGDRVAPYQSVVTVMDIAGELGFHQQRLTTQAPR